MIVEHFSNIQLDWMIQTGPLLVDRGIQMWGGNSSYTVLVCSVELWALLGHSRVPCLFCVGILKQIYVVLLHHPTSTELQIVDTYPDIIL